MSWFQHLAIQELDEYFMKMDAPETFALTDQYSTVFHKFLSRELQCYRAIRGRVTGPVSFGFKVLDENLKGKCQMPSSEERTVEKAFAFLLEFSQILRHKYGV
jgi:hypothetical protein